ncbi:MAG: serine/threonine-protein kinase [Chloroflexota bacterium]|nr:serine/threonine-protein kinase [Chloroflexota bacterium]
MSTTLIGKKLGKYTVTASLGQGGMATVYVGHQDDIDRDVAIKVLAPHPGQDARFVGRFRQEARTIARLQHPHILPVYDYGDEDNILYLVMAYIRGGTLSERIRRGALNISETDRLIHEIGGALDYAHRQNVVHRDIKPANILLDREGHALLTDFGIAKLMEESSGLTGTGNLVGTPSYMSPEQAQSVEVDHRSDLYSLAVVAFEMLTGRQPFPGDTAMQTVLKHISAPPPLHMLPPTFVPVIGKALAKAPQDRYQSVADFVNDFSRAARGEMIVPDAPESRTLQFSANDATLNMPTGTGSYAPPTGTNMATGTGANQSYQSYPGYPTTNQPTPTTTIIQQQPLNPLVLLGGFVIIAALVAAVVLLALRSNEPPNVLVNGNPPLSGTAPGIEIVTAPLVPVAPAEPIFGRVSFSSSRALGDTVSVRVDDLPAPPQGRYAVWLINPDTGAALSLGSVALDPLGAGAMTYTDSDGATLPALYNQLVITSEAEPGDAPNGAILFQGGVPSSVAPALIEILQTSPDGIPPRGGTGANFSLIQSALAEAEIAVQHAGLAARANSIASMQTHSEHTINILRGREAQEDLNGSGRAENPGRGFGVPYFLDLIDAQLAAITDVPDATPQIQSQVELIRVCIINARGWVDDIIVREQAMLAADSIERVTTEIEESTLFTANLVDGEDLNGNGQVEPFEGECGLSQIVEYGIAVGSFSIVRGES